MLYTKFKDHRPADFGDFWRVLIIYMYGHGDHLVSWPGPFEQTLIPYHTEAPHENETVFSEENYVHQPYFVLGATLRDEVWHTQTL